MQKPLKTTAKTLLAVWTITLFTLLACPATSFAQADESEQLAQAKQRIAQLEKQIRVLEAKLNLLEAQAKNQAETKDAASTPPVTPAVEAGSRKSISDQAHTKPSSPVKPQPRTFRTVLQPIQQLPPNLRPRNGVWESNTVDAVNLWLDKNIPGNKLESKFNIKVTTFSRSKKLVDDKYVYTYRLWIYLTTPNFTYLGVDFKASTKVEVFADEQLAEAYKKLDPDIPLRVTGLLDAYKVAYTTVYKIPGTVTWELKDWKIHSPHLPD